MANAEHLEILKKGVSAWNEWRTGQLPPDPSGLNIWVPDPRLADLGRVNLRGVNLCGVNLSSAVLCGVNLSRAVLCGVNLSHANLRDADLGNADLSNADLRGADLTGANLNLADLTGANLNFADLRVADLSHANLFEAKLFEANLSGGNLGRANLDRANLFEANLIGANLFEANLIDAKLRGAHMTDADLSGANLSRADLSHANLSRANLAGANLNKAIFGDTLFTDVDLSAAIGLNTARHWGPSSIGVDTIYQSQGEIPDEFLKDAGVPEEIIDIARSIRNGLPIQWNSCFISYSTKDDEFASRLHLRMRQANMRVWFAPEDAKGGEKLHKQLFEAIQLQDRLLLVLSPNSIKSEWVMTEIRKAREIEKKENRRKLFPIRLVDFKALSAWTCFDADTGKDLAVEVREYFIPDFSNWKDHDAFEEAFLKLQKDLESR